MIVGDPYAILGWPTILLMQLAHPEIAEAIHRSESLGSPGVRFLTTYVASRKKLVSPELDATTTSSINRAHHKIPEVNAGNLAWAGACTIAGPFAALNAFRKIPAEAFEYAYLEAKPSLRKLGANPPPTLRDLEEYVAKMSAELEVSDLAREMAAQILHPPIPGVGVLSPVARAITAHLLPEGLAEQYGLSRTNDARIFHGVETVAHALNGLVTQRDRDAFTGWTVRIAERALARAASKSAADGGLA